MCWEQTEIVRQRENLRLNRVEQCFRAAFLEVCPTAAADEDCITGKGDALLLHDEGNTAVGVAWCWYRNQLVPSKLDRLAIGQPAVGIRSGMLSDDAKRAWQQLLEISGARNVVGMTMSVQGELQLETELFDQDCIAWRLLEHWKAI